MSATSQGEPLVSEVRLPGSPSGARVPTAVKYGFTAFMAVLVPFYWQAYGPTNFLYFCDIALFLTLAAVWTEKPWFASTAAVGIVMPQLLWQADFLAQIVGVPLTGMTGYMFDGGIALFARSLSFFHFWLPILLLYLIARLGYDRRALVSWTVVAWAAILVAYFWLPAPGDPLTHPNEPHNVNYVYGLSDEAPQQWMPGPAWLALLLAGLPAVVYFPTHLVLGRLWGREPR